MIGKIPPRELVAKPKPSWEEVVRKNANAFLATAAAIATVGLSSVIMIGAPAPAIAQQAAEPAVDNDDIGGVVTGTHGPEAGVWVIAETVDLPTKFAKIVVTDDQGRYVIPDLPVANYSVFVRGYGLVDSPRMRAKPGQHLDLTATPAPNAAEAAHYYPAIYWYSLLKIPADNELKGSSPLDDPGLHSKQANFLRQMKNVGCIGCHELGQEATRTIPAQFGTFKTGEEAWIRRVQSGLAGQEMTGEAGFFNAAPLKALGDWTDRIAGGELPKSKPPRPEGVERNLVITTWEWGTPSTYTHDLISSDRRNPTVNANGPLFGSPEYASDDMPILDPKTSKVTFFKMPVEDPNMRGVEGFGFSAEPMAPSAYWGDKKIWETKANNHNAMFDKKGRVWLAATVRGMDNPAFCKKGSDHPSAKAFPLDQSARQAALLDPKTMKYTFVDTCFSTHHLQFAYDADDTLWFSGTGPVAGWINTKVFDETGDAAKAQGWSPWVLDTNGNGKRDDYVEPGQPADSGKDTRVDLNGLSGPYAVMPNPADGSVWYTIGVFGAHPSAVLRFDPKTGLSEIYNVPLPGFGIRGGDIDGNGVVWASLTSGQLASFDRRKCKGPLNGPKATGDHCPEGWSFYKYPGPGFDGVGDNSAEASYYTWVDQHNTLGLGDNVPISTANLNDGFAALQNGKMVMLRVPYPMGFYAKGLDGRIDDPNTGWKGRGLWSSAGDRTPWLKESGKGSKPLVVHFQVRPDPLAH
jgi:hypothetical protein